MERITAKYYDADKVRIVDIDGRIWTGRVKWVLCAPDYEPDEEALVIDTGGKHDVEILGKEMKSVEVLNWQKQE